ncbi:unnamed protein product [Orchesella dallaii]|uniref:Generative cell specific-1/HAP2 domain-containing protein n=1 Tax=Orchesella dallaii TaxID=48710 RepID=A0ABP1Q4V9_9HEXA
MKLLVRIWMKTAYIPFLLLFLRFLPVKGGTIARNTTAMNNGTVVAFDGPPGDNMATTFVAVSANLGNPIVTRLNGSHEEPCEQIPEEVPPDLCVTLKNESGLGKWLQEEENLELGKDGKVTQVEDEDGVSILCMADYPVVLEFQLNDGHFSYFFTPDGKYCKCEPKGCSLCFQLGIRIPMKIWNSLEWTRLAFTCRSISGRALMQKKAVLTRIENLTHDVEILSESTEKLETSVIPLTSNGHASVRIGNCQLDSHGDRGFLGEVSGKIPACKDTEKGTKPCLAEVNPVPVTGIKDNAYMNTAPSPFLDMEVLERMICNFGSSSLHDKNTGKNEHSVDFGGMKNQSITEPTSDCCYTDCLWNLLLLFLVILGLICWMIFINYIRPWCLSRKLARVHKEFQVVVTNVTMIMADISNLLTLLKCEKLYSSAQK